MVRSFTRLRDIPYVTICLFMSIIGAGQSGRYIRLSTIIRLISAIAFEGFMPFGHAFVQL